MTLSIIYVLTVILFLTLLLSLGFQPKAMTRITGVILLFAGISGILLYGYGYSILYDNIPQAAIRTLFSVFCMFLGRNEIGAISAAPLLQKPVMQLYIYTVHLLALYSTASAVVAAIGARFIRALRLLLMRRGNLNLIYGVNEDTVSFAQKLQKEENGVVVFVDTGSGASLDGKILRMGSLMISTEDARIPTAAFLKKIGVKPGKRHLTLFCLDENMAGNLRYAESMCDLLQQAGVHPEQTSLTILLEEEANGAALQTSGEGETSVYGFGSVLAIERPDLVARLMVKACRPYETMSFDESGRAAEDFEALIIGFGRTGQAVLRSLVMNGQFSGSRFHATVIARNYSQQSGSFFFRFPGLKDSYHIDFIDSDARSITVYEHISTKFHHLNYVAVCTGDEKENAEIAEELARFLHDLGLNAPIVQCSSRGIIRISEGSGLPSLTSLYAPEILCGSKLDTMAMIINHQYHISEGNTVYEDWASCDYFSRMSCRASADYLDAFLFAARRDRASVLRDGWRPDGPLMENLGQTEHLRWCAFHYAMGYQTMPESVFEERAALYRTQKQETGSGSVRIGKDTENRLHACLIPWDDLDALGEREFGITGKPVDYKEMDRENVRMIPNMLKSLEE